MGVKSFQYQALARSLTAETPGPSVAFTLHEPPDQLPPKARIRAPWHEPAVTFSAALIAAPPDPSRAIKYQSALPLPVKMKRLEPAHMQVCSRDGITLPTLPAPQRAYVELTPPNPVVRRFRPEQQYAETGTPPAVLPVVVRLFGGAGPLPMKGPRTGACHAPFISYTPPQTLPTPFQVYESCGFPMRSRQRIIPECTSFVAYPRSDAPALCWSQASEPLPKMVKRLAVAVTDSTRVLIRYQIGPITFMPYEYVPRTPHPLNAGFVAFSGTADKAPPFFGHPPSEVPLTRSKARNVVDVQQTSVIVTTNEKTLPGAWRCETDPPITMKRGKPWLAWQAFAGPFQTDGGGTGPGPGGVPACRFITLVGTDSTAISLTGDGDAPRTIALTGIDSTAISLTGEC